MNQQIKEEWLAALKSGEYTQGTQKLLTIENPEYNPTENTKEDYGRNCVVKYCCLGVLGKIAEKHGVAKFKNYFLVDLANGDRSTCYLTDYLMGWAGLDNETQNKLMKTNDRFCDGKYTAVIPLIESL